MSEQVARQIQPERQRRKPPPPPPAEARRAPERERPARESAIATVESPNHPNEDYAFVSHDKRFVALGDGLSNPHGGAIASRAAVEHLYVMLGNAPEPASLQVAKEEMAAAIQDTSEYLRTQSHRAGLSREKAPLTTLEAVRFWTDAKAKKQFAIIGSVGDSRLMVFRRGEEIFSTRKDSVRNYLTLLASAVTKERSWRGRQKKKPEPIPQFSPDQAGDRLSYDALLDMQQGMSGKGFTQDEMHMVDWFVLQNAVGQGDVVGKDVTVPPPETQHALTQAMGQMGEVRPHVEAIQLEPGDEIIVASDGMNLTSERVAEILRGREASASVKDMIRESMAVDDRTAVRIRVNRIGA